MEAGSKVVVRAVEVMAQAHSEEVVKVAGEMEQRSSEQRLEASRPCIR